MQKEKQEQSFADETVDALESVGKVALKGTGKALKAGLKGIGAATKLTASGVKKVNQKRKETKKSEEQE